MSIIAMKTDGTSVPVADEVKANVLEDVVVRLIEKLALASVIDVETYEYIVNSSNTAYMSTTSA